MCLRKSVVACAVLLFCAGMAEAGFLESFATSLAENKAIEQAPDCTLSADEAYARSIELLSDGRQTEAEELIQSAVKSYRDDIRILFAKAVLDRSRWAKSSANVWFAMVWQAQGNEALSRAAGLSGKLDRHEAVEKNMAELIRLSDEHPDEIYLLWLGAIQCREQDMGELGRQRYEKLLEKFRLGPVMAHHTYANILAEILDDYEPALEHRILAVSMEAKSWSLYGMGNTLVSMGKNEWGCAVLARVVRWNPYNAKYVNRLGDALYNMERYAEAAEMFWKATSLEPREGYLWEELGECLRKQGKYDESFECFQRALELGGNVLDNLAYCYQFGQGVEKDEEKAFELYWLHWQKHPESAWVLCKLGFCYSNGVGVEKDLLKAMEYYEEAVVLSPDYVDAWNGLSRNLGKALHDDPRTVALGVDWTLGTVAVVCFKNKQYDEAVRVQERFMAYWKSQNQGKPVPAGQLKRLERYKKIRKEVEESF